MNNPRVPYLNTGDSDIDLFRMYSYKIQQCPHKNPHNWGNCPFVHPGETAKRRDLVRFTYSSKPCPNFSEKKQCEDGDQCRFAHGLFESFLHPTRYKTQLCHSGTSYNRRVCFFAHTAEEKRLAIPSPPSANSTVAAIDVTAPSAMPSSSFASRMNPRPGNGISQSSIARPQQNVPALHLPGSHLQMRRPRPSVNPSDLQSDDSQVQPHPHLNDLSRFPANPDVLFSPEFMSSPISSVKTSVFPHQSIEQSLFQPSPQSIDSLRPSSSKLPAFADHMNPQQQSPSVSSWYRGPNPSLDLGRRIDRDLRTNDFLSYPVNGKWGASDRSGQ